MRPAVYDETVVDIDAPGRRTCCARKGSTLKFKGFLAVYEESPDEKVEQKPQAERGARREAEEARRPTTRPTQLPPLAEGDVARRSRSSTPTSTSRSRRRASARRAW